MNLYSVNHGGDSVLHYYEFSHIAMTDNTGIFILITYGYPYKPDVKMDYSCREYTQGPL